MISEGGENCRVYYVIHYFYVLINTFAENFTAQLFTKEKTRMSGRWVHSHAIETSPDICFEYILFVQKYPDIFRVNLSVQDKLFHELTKFVAPMPLHIMTFIFSCLEQLNG